MSNNKTDQQYIEEIKKTYLNFISKNEYVYKSCDNGNKIVILKKPENNKNNEKRENIYDSRCAKYRTNFMEVVVIFDKFTPNNKFDSTTSTWNSITTDYEVNKYVFPDKYIDNNDEINHGIYYFLSIECAFYYDLDKTNYSGQFYEYHYNGRIKKSGFLENGKINKDYSEWNENGEKI